MTFNNRTISVGIFGGKIQTNKAFLKTILVLFVAIIMINFNHMTAHADTISQSPLKVENGVLYGFSDGKPQHIGATVVIPSNVTSIANTAFYNQGIGRVDFSTATKLKSIGDFAFAKNHLSTVNYPNLDDNNLGWYIFYDNAINSVTFANGVTHINDGAFAKNVNLTAISLPSTITAIGDWAFSGDRLSNIDLTTIKDTNDLNVGSGAFYGNQASRVAVLPNKRLNSSGKQPIRWYGYEAFGQNTGQANKIANQYALKHQAYGTGTPGNINAANSFTYDTQNPSVITGVKSGVTTLGKTIVIPANVTKIADNAFKSLGIVAVDFSKAAKLKQIGNFAFYDNQISNTLTLPNRLNPDISGIGWYAFASNNISKINLPNNNMTALNDFIFASNQLSGIDLPNTLQSMGDGTFLDNQIKDVALPSSLQRVGSGSFVGNLFNQQRSIALTDAVNQMPSEKDFSAVLYPFGATTSQAKSPIKKRFMKMPNGEWQYLGNKGLPLTGQQIIDGHTYYFNPDGTQVKGYSVTFKDGSVHQFDANSGDKLN
ncbi:leucine-rich repeat protein [Leuconostoc inhae]|uniref:leucine-rich repeat protein n=1 Tax=Leuconostoc inhae TaxID=178001 RepID=UPI001C7D925A|nr:leucine-rich repeat protein [Leuconostoc inhae]